MDKDKNFLVITGIITVIIILILVGSYGSYFYFRGKDSSDAINALKALKEEVIKKPLYERKIDGLMIEDSEKTDLFPVGVIIENNMEAWPLSGIEKAKIVYEFEAEAAIPRFLAIYTLDEKVDKIGPVRSARPYFIDMNLGYDALFAHIGGSPQALIDIKTFNVKDLNQFYYWANFWRSEDRGMPHNVYTSTELLQNALDERELEGPTIYDQWQYKDEEGIREQKKTEEEDRDLIKKIQVDFSNSVYKAIWQYNAEKNEYLRYQGDEKVLTMDNQEVWAKNIIVVQMDRQILDNEGRRSFTTIGERDAYFFFDGTVIKGKYQKDEKTKREKFFTLNGDEIKLNRGITWIEVTRDMDIVSWE